MQGSIGTTPNMLLKGYNVGLPIDAILLPTTSYLPGKVKMFVNEIVDKLDILRRIGCQTKLEIQEKRRMANSKKTQDHKLSTGDLVMRKIPHKGKKLDPKWEGPYELGAHKNPNFQ